MKKLLSSGSGGTDAAGADSSGGGSAVVREGRSVFHTKLTTNACPADMDAAVDSVRQYVAALQHFCGAGSHVSRQFASLLSATVYSDVAEQFEAVAKEVDGVVKTEGCQVQTDVETLWSQLGRSYEGEDKPQEGSTISSDIKVGVQTLRHFSSLNLIPLTRRLRRHATFGHVVFCVTPACSISALSASQDLKAAQASRFVTFITAVY